MSELTCKSLSSWCLLLGLRFGFFFWVLTSLSRGPPVNYNNLQNWSLALKSLTKKGVNDGNNSVIPSHPFICAYHSTIALNKFTQHGNAQMQNKNTHRPAPSPLAVTKTYHSSPRVHVKFTCFIIYMLFPTNGYFHNLISKVLDHNPFLKRLFLDDSTFICSYKIWHTPQ